MNKSYEDAIELLYDNQMYEPAFALVMCLVDVKAKEKYPELTTAGNVGERIKKFLSEYLVKGKDSDHVFSGIFSCLVNSLYEQRNGVIHDAVMSVELKDGPGGHFQTQSISGDKLLSIGHGIILQLLEIVRES